MRPAPRLVYTGTKYRELLAQAGGAPMADDADDASMRRSSIWATVARAKDDGDGDGNGPGFEATATEYQVGVNRNISANTVVGISVGRSNGNVEIDRGGSDGDLDTTSVGAFVRHDSGNFYVSGLLSYSKHDINSDRVTGGFGTVSADYDARTIALWGEVGKKFVRGGLNLEPNISLKLSNTKQDGFTESGLGGLSVSGDNYNSRRLGIGVRISSNDNASKFRPYGFLGFEREFGDDSAALTNQLGGLPAFRVNSSELGKNIWAARLGADARINDRFSLVGEVGASWRDNQKSKYIYGGVKYGW